jgi:hypothetical protein
MSEFISRTRLVERALELFATLVREDKNVAEQLEYARVEFFGPGSLGATDEAASQRFLEWFLFEHDNEALGGRPGRLLMERWVERAEVDMLSLSTTIFDSIASVFEVSGVEETGVWVGDLAGSGEYPLVEPEAAGELAVGDLVVGRIYAVGDGLFRASPASVCIRDATLARALRTDLSRARTARRGTSRMSQALLEQMFFQGIAEAARGSENPSVVLARVRRWLLQHGLDEERVDATLEALREEPYERDLIAPGNDDAVGRVLEFLAFETQLDLDTARRHLLDAWSALWREFPAAVDEDAPTRAAVTPASTRPSDDDARDPLPALDEFDRARAAGADLGALFDRLERDLGLETEVADDDDTAPDFPGVVGAMVEEFLWEEDREGVAEPLQRARTEVVLRKLASCVAHIGVFEELSAADVVLFTSCFLLEHGELVEAEDALVALDAVERFCRWAQENHEVRVFDAVKDTLGSQRESLPRLVVANRQLASAEVATRVLVFEVTSPGPTTALRRESEQVDVELDAEVHQHLRSGDLVRATRDQGALRVLGCYPPESRAVLGRI